jgi:hypothetical protein
VRFRPTWKNERDFSFWARKSASRRLKERAVSKVEVISMIKKVGVATLFALASALAACAGNTPEAQEPEHVVAEERAEKAQEATEDNTDRAENAADSAEDSAVESEKSADKAEKAADDSKK